MCFMRASGNSTTVSDSAAYLTSRQAVFEAAASGRYWLGWRYVIEITSYWIIADALGRKPSSAAVSFIFPTARLLMGVAGLALFEF